MPEESATKSEEVMGCAVLLAIAVGIVWVVWGSAFDCFLADQFDYVTKECALIHLRKPACNSDRDILEVDEIRNTSYTEKGKREEIRIVIYRFQKRPVSGPVSADVLRDSASLFKTAQGRWLASCENVGQ